jgi:hypothetical protein
MTMRVMPPADGLHPNITVNGRAYSCALGSSIIVPDCDGLVMAANGWTNASFGGSGTTAQRPANPKQGAEYHDETLGKVIRFDGKVWRNLADGSAA